MALEVAVEHPAGSGLDEVRVICADVGKTAAKRPREPLVEAETRTGSIGDNVLAPYFCMGFSMLFVDTGKGFVSMNECGTIVLENGSLQIEK